MSSMRLLSWLLVAVPAAVAQTAVSHPLPNAASRVVVGGALEGQQWLAELGPTRVLGGSLVGNRSALLDTGNPLQLKLGTNNTVPRVLVVEEDSPAGYMLHGLSMDGRWVPSGFPTAAPISNYQFGEQIALFDVGTVNLLWNQWAGAWQVFSNMSQGQPVQITAVSGAIGVFDGAQLFGYSPFDWLPVLLPTTFAQYMPGTGSTGRKTIAYLLGPDDIAVFCAQANRWATIHEAGIAGALTWIEYDENYVMFAKGNEAIFVSAYTGNSVRHTFTDLPGILAGGAAKFILEDNVALFWDNVHLEGVIYQPVDDDIVVVAGLAANDTFDINNDLAGFIKGGNRTWEFYGGLRRHPLAAAFTLPPGAALIRSRRDDCSMVVVSDEFRAYGFSSVTGGWTSIPLQYANAANATNLITSSTTAQDFVSFLRTDTHVYAHVLRTGLWCELPYSGSITTLSDDGCVAFVFGGQAYVLGTESLGFTAIPAAATAVSRKCVDDYYYEISDDPNGPGSLVRFWSRHTNRVTVRQTSYRFTNANLAAEVLEADQGLVLWTPSEVIVLTALADLTCQYHGPMDNYPYYAAAGSPTARFLATGSANGLQWVIFGFQRAPSAVVLPVLGLVDVPASPLPLIVLGGFYDARGVRDFQIGLPPGLTPITFMMQNIHFDPAATAIEFGNGVFSFQVN